MKKNGSRSCVLWGAFHLSDGVDVEIPVTLGR